MKKIVIGYNNFTKKTAVKITWTGSYKNYWDKNTNEI